MRNDMDLSGGLSPEHELFFPSRPQDPEMRESTSVWIMEENGEFAIARIGIEGEAHSWDNRLYHGAITLPGGRVLRDMGRGAVPSPFDAAGKPSIFGAGPLTFRMIEPFKRWAMTYESTAEDTDNVRQMSQDTSPRPRVPVKLEVEMEMITPGWVQDNSPEKVALMSPAERGDAESMGVGWRIEHHFRANGTFTVDGDTRSFRGVGNRIKRQSIRPLKSFRGVVWQAAVFPDGRAFGMCIYPPLPDGTTYNDAYILTDGKMHVAKVTKAPWLRRLEGRGADVSLELKSDLGITPIKATVEFSNFMVNSADVRGITIHHGTARYEWDGQSAYGMLVRSSPAEEVEGPDPIG